MTDLSTTEIVIDMHGFNFRVDSLPDNDDTNPEQIDVLLPNDVRITLTGGCEVCTYPSKKSCFYYSAESAKQMPEGFYNFLIQFSEAYKIELKKRENQGRSTKRFTKRAWNIGWEFFYDFESAKEAINEGWTAILSRL